MNLHTDFNGCGLRQSCNCVGNAPQTFFVQIRVTAVTAAVAVYTAVAVTAVTVTVAGSCCVHQSQVIRFNSCTKCKVIERHPISLSLAYAHTITDTDTHTHIPLFKCIPLSFLKCVLCESDLPVSSCRRAEL